MVTTKVERHDDQDEMSVGKKLTIGIILWKTTKGLVKLAAIAGAAVLGWRVVTQIFERLGGSAEDGTPATA